MFINVQNPRMTRISFASSNKFKICLLIGGGMAVSSSSESICFSLEKNGVVNVYGKKGSGKTTYIVNQLKKYIKFDHEILKSKDKTIDFMDMMRFSKFPLILDDYELVENLPGTKEIFVGQRKFLLIVISQERLNDCTTSYEFPGVPVDVFAKSLGTSQKLVEELLKKANGNMTAVKLDLENFKSERDVFLNSKEYVSEIIREGKLSSYIDRHLTEHGNTLGIVHENYIDYCECTEKIANSLSDADIIDMKIYSDVSWDLMNYFNVTACLLPAMYMGKSPTALSCHLRPGSIWTKTSNMLMRRNRLKRLGIKDRDEIYVWALKANAGEEMNPKFDSYDLDSINQLSFTKIKSRVLTTLKKKNKCPPKKSAPSVE